MQSGRLLVSGSDFYCGNSSGSLCQFALKSQIPSQYVHPSTKQCNYSVNLSGYAKSSELNSLKTSVSSGKSLVATAVTGKGVSTAADASFQTIANNINTLNVLVSGSIEDLYLNTLSTTLYLSDLASNMYNYVLSGDTFYENWYGRIDTYKITKRASKSLNYDDYVYYNRQGASGYTSEFGIVLTYNRNTKTLEASLSTDTLSSIATLKISNQYYDKSNHKYVVDVLVTSTSSTWGFDSSDFTGHKTGYIHVTFENSAIVSIPNVGNYTVTL